MRKAELTDTCAKCGAVWIQDNHYDPDSFVMVHDPYCEDAHARKLVGAKEYARLIPNAQFLNNSL